MNLNKPEYLPGQKLDDGMIYVGFMCDYHLVCMAKDEPALFKWGNKEHWPTKEELYLMYANKDLIGGFTSDWYWSSTEDSNSFAWIQRFSDGYQLNGFKTNSYLVRCVRRYKSFDHSIISPPAYDRFDFTALEKRVAKLEKAVPRKRKSK